MAVMVYAGWKLNFVPGVAELAGFLALAIFGALIHLSLITILACVSFWTVRAQGIVWGYYNLFNIARLPDEAFRGAFKAVFTFVLPMLLVSNVPVKLLLDKLSSPMEWVRLLVIGGLLIAASEWVWRFAVKRYTSASS